ncbi:MAG: molybdate ABC transporter permease subunit [Coriobacteriia bacterium]|nr:molybdate ABC transporter permease subunit [Coriobacteriia bacterium]
MIAFADIAFPLRLSLQVALLATFGCAVIGVPMAYLLATREFRGKAIADVAVMLPLVLPPVVTGYYLLLVIGRRGLLGKVTESLTGTAYGISFTWQAAVIASFAIALPLAVSTARAAIAAVDPAHADASRTLGHGEIATALRVVLPLASRGIAAGLALAFARALGEFGATVMVAGNIPGRTNTMALQIYNAVLYGDWRGATMLVAVFTVVSAGMLLLANRLTRAVAR